MQQQMSIEDEILTLAAEMEKLLLRFKKSSSDGLFLSTEDQSQFKRLALEAKAAIDTALGGLNDFSVNLLSSINAGSGGFFGGPSYSAVSEAAQILRGAVNQYLWRVEVGCTGLSDSANTGFKPPPPAVPLFTTNVSPMNRKNRPRTNVIKRHRTSR
jgi:hypothetical protein